MYRVTRLLRTCKPSADNKFYSNAAPSILQYKELFESLNVGEVNFAKPLITITSSSFVGKTIEDQRKMVKDRLPEDLQNKVDFHTIAKEEFGEVSPVVMNKVENLSETRLLTSPQAHLDEAVCLLSRLEPCSASKQLFLCGSLALKNLSKNGGVVPKSYRAESILVDFLRERYGCKGIYTTWRVLKDCHANGYEDWYSVNQVRRDIEPTIKFCNDIYKLHKKQESRKKKTIEWKDFENWFEDEHNYSEKTWEEFEKLYGKI